MNELKPITIALMVAGMGASTAAVAAQASSAELNALSSRVEALETKASESPVRAYGLLDVAVIKSGNESDVTAAYLELGVEADINDSTTANIIFLQENIDTVDDTGFNLDTATLTVNMGPTYLTAGQMELPFGRYDSYQIDYPLTMQAADTYNSVIQIGFDTGRVYGSLLAFNGESQKVTDTNKVAHYAGNLGFMFERNSFSLDIGGSYISSFAESGIIVDTLGAPAAPLPPIDGLPDLVTGMGMHLTADMGPFSLIYESVKASGDVTGAVGTQVAASNIEAAIHMMVAGKDSTLAISSQGTADAAWLGLPEKAVLATYAMEVRDATTLSVQFSSSKDYAGVKTNSTAVQLGIEF